MAKPYVNVFSQEVPDTLDDLDDVLVSGLADNNLLAYDSTTGKWINQTGQAAGLVTSTTTVLHYDEIISNNDDIVTV